MANSYSVRSGMSTEKYHKLLRLTCLIRRDCVECLRKLSALNDHNESLKM